MGKNSLRKKIMLKGVTTTPDDYLCEDGELAGAMGVESTDGGMEGVSQHGPKVVIDMKSNNLRVVYEHKVKPQYNWIVWNEDPAQRWLAFIRDNEEKDTFDPNLLISTNSLHIGSEEIPTIEAIGNTLIVRTVNGGKSMLSYVLWKPDSNSYKHLGTHIPELAMQFGLGIDYVKDFGRSTKGDHKAPYLVNGLAEDMEVPNFTVEDGNKARITQSVMASVNKTQYNAMKDGYFVQPFLVRYAMKMYDGTTTMASAPVYMPVTEKNDDLSYPICVVDEVEENGLRFHTEHVRSKLKYRVLDDAETIRALKEWSDIIKGVDICVSAPIYTYNPAGLIERTLGSINTDDGSDATLWAGEMMKYASNEFEAYGTLDGEHLMSPEDVAEYFETTAAEVIERRKAYKGWGFEWLRKNEFQPAPGSGEPSFGVDSLDVFSDSKYWDDGENNSVVAITPRIVLLMPEKTVSDFTKEVSECSNFYKVSEIKLEDIQPATAFRDTDNTPLLKDVEIEEGVLNNVQVKQPLEDEYRSHDKICGNVLKTYNARLNLADVSRELWSGFAPEIFIMHYDERRTLSEGSMVAESDMRITVEISEKESTIVVKSRTGRYRAGRYDIMPYLYFPNTNATRIYIEIGSDAVDFSLEHHSGLNGAVFYSGSMNKKDTWKQTEGTIPSQSTSLTVEEPNKLYTSQAENPWKFLPTNINTVGSGKILGVGAVTTALSQGQHGSFPMYCMTTEGVWSLSVNSTGGWSTSQTVTRDVMREGTPILLIDDAIIFMSTQGLMMLQGDRTVMMTGAQKGKPTIRISKLPGLKRLIMSGTLASFGTMISSSATDKEIDEALTGDLMAYLNSDGVDLYYDYVNQRVIVGCYGTEKKTYCWVYYLDKRQWTMAPWKLMNHVNTYPECYAMLEKNDGSNYMVKLDTTERDWSDDEAGGDGLEDDVLLLTRPIKLGEAADMLKELENMTVEGLYDKQKLGMAVWGTRDYKHWHLVGSCKGLHLVRKHGSGYRAFVVAITGKLGAEEYLDTLTMEYQPRLVRKLHGMGYSES